MRSRVSNSRTDRREAAPAYNDKKNKKFYYSESGRKKAASSTRGPALATLQAST